MCDVRYNYYHFRIAIFPPVVHTADEKLKPLNVIYMEDKCDCKINAKFPQNFHNNLSETTIRTA